MPIKTTKLIAGAFILMYALISCVPATPFDKEKPTEFITEDVPSLTSTVSTPSANVNPSVESKNITNKCPTIINDGFNDLKGVAVVVDDSSGKNFFLNLENRDIKEIPDSYGFVTSADHNLLAYIDASDKDSNSWKVVVIGSHYPQVSLPRSNDWSNYLNITQITNQGMLLINSKNSFLLVNPLTGIEQKVPSNFPDQKPSFEVSQWSGPIYDPLLRFAIYPRNPGNENNGERIVLWDIENKKAIAYISSDNVYGSEPVWAADSINFAIALIHSSPNGSEASELYAVNIEGKISQLTDLSTSYLNSFITNYQWSPNSKKIAFWLATQEEDGNRLMILNVETGEITAYCFSSQILANPVWSPDGQWLLARIDQEKGSSVISINVVNNMVVKITEDKTPLSWIIAP